MIILIPIGLLLILLGLMVFVRMRRGGGGSRAEGMVIDLEKTEDSEGTSFSPIVQFTLPDGTSSTFTSSIASYPSIYKVGEQVKVLYDPGNPGNARLASSWKLHIVTIILVALGVILIGVWLRWG